MTTGYELQDLLDNLTTPYDKSDSSNNALLAQAHLDGFWTQFCDDLVDSRLQVHSKTATQYSLDRHALFYFVIRNAGETDSAFRARFAAAKLRRLASVTPDDILERVESIIGGVPGDVTIVENTDPDTGEYRGGYYYVEFDINKLLTAGYAGPSIAGLVDAVQDALSEASAAGILGEVLPSGGALWDDAAALWDDPSTLWGA